MDTPSTPKKRAKVKRRPFFRTLEDDIARMLQPLFIEILTKGVRNLSHFHSAFQSKHGTITRSDFRRYLQICDLLDLFKKRRMIQLEIHRKPTPVYNSRTPTPEPDYEDDDPDFIPFTPPKQDGGVPPSGSPLVAGDPSGWSPPPDPYGVVTDPKTGAPRTFI